MADKAISELISAEQILPTDNLVVEQNNTAKRLPGQVLLNFLVAAADGHGGIKSIEKTGTNVLVDTYTITLADLTTFQFTVSNGKSIRSIQKTGTSGLVDTYRISFNDGSTQNYTVTNGAKGDKGDNAYVHIKWASQKPTSSSHSFGDVPDNWMGIYNGNSATAPTSYAAYTWYEIKGAKGNTGTPATLSSQKVEYQVSTSGTIYPSGVWTEEIPETPSGRYLWTRVTLQFNTGNPVVSYSVGRMGIDGSGAVSTVNQVSPDSNGNVSLNADNVGALPKTGGTMTGPINMNGKTLSGLNPPTADSHAANKGYVDGKKTRAAITLTVSGWVNNAQTVSVSGMTTAKDVIVSPDPADAENFNAYTESMVRAVTQGSGTLTFRCDSVPGKNLTVNIIMLG